jgi:hypothetical protein
LGVLGELRDEIVDKVLEVSNAGNCVPGREDVSALWDFWGPCGGGGGKLKDLVQALHVGMRRWCLFQEDAGGQWHEGFLLGLVRRLMWEAHGDWKEWRSGRQKVVEAQTRDELEDPSAEANSKDKGIGRGAEGGGKEEFVTVGRLRRPTCDYHEYG